MKTRTLETVRDYAAPRLISTLVDLHVARDLIAADRLNLAEAVLSRVAETLTAIAVMELDGLAPAFNAWVKACGNKLYASNYPTQCRLHAEIERVLGLDTQLDQEALRGARWLAGL